MPPSRSANWGAKSSKGKVWVSHQGDKDDKSSVKRRKKTTSGRKKENKKCFTRNKGGGVCGVTNHIDATKREKSHLITIVAIHLRRGGKTREIKRGGYPVQSHSKLSMVCNPAPGDTGGKKGEINSRTLRSNHPQM